MEFRSEPFRFDSPDAAVGGFVERLGGMEKLGVEAVPLDSATGRVLAEALTTDRESPAFDTSAMDGFAVRAAEAVAGAMLRVVGEVRIGEAPLAVPGLAGAVRVVTGAAIPAGADAVVKRENVDERGGMITIRSAELIRVREGDHIRPRGENARRGEIVASPGSVLTASMIGALAAVGCHTPRVFAACRVAVITTGDEVVPPSSSPGEYQVRDSNGPTVRAVLGSCRWIRIPFSKHVADDIGQVAATVREALPTVDAVVLVGGVSMGHRDPVREAVESLGAEVVFHGVPQRPGKPMLGAVLKRAGTGPMPIFCLPGNPVSAMVTCVRIVLPVLASCAGMERLPGPRAVQVENPDGRTIELWWHRLVRRTQGGGVELIDARGSGDVIAGGQSDGFIEVSPGVARSQYPFYSWPT